MTVVNRMQLDNTLSDKIMGIDLGTTNSAVAVYTSGLVPTLCPMGTNGKTTMQSCVRWDGGDKFTVGPEAYAERYKDNVVYSVKRLMGSGETVTLTRDNDTLTMTPAQVSAEILKALKSVVNEYYPGLHRCIITVPAYFDQRQIEETVEASKMAGLECVQILKEPTSASYIYSQLGHAGDGSILIYDLGGGTFDVTHMSFLRRASIPKKMITALRRMYNIDVDAMGDDKSSLYFCRVLGTYGDTKLGGDDIDTEFATIVSKRVDCVLSPNVMEELKLRCEQFKKSGVEAQDITLGGVKLNLKREDLEHAIENVFHRTMRIVDQIPQDELQDVKTIVLVGGSTKSNYLVSLLEKTFPGKEISRVLDPDATVALGAGAVAKDLQEGKCAMYQDVLPMAIGVLKAEKEVDVCIPKNTAMPYSVSRTYNTLYDNQEAVSIDVYQGVSTKPEDCTYLGKLRIANLPPKPAGELKVVVSFLLSAQGRLKVTTYVDGVQEVRELLIDSIFDIKKEEETPALGVVLDYDDFEKAIASLCVGNEELTALVLSRRELLINGDVTGADAVEEKILEAL